MKKVIFVNFGRANEKSLKLQLFANLDEIVTQNAQAFEGVNVKDSFTTLSSKLGELGYDVLINNKKQAEFIPASRLSEVVSQRDTFKSQLEGLNAQLETIKKSAGDNKVLQDQIQKQMDDNNKLLKDLESMKIQTEIVMAAKDAVNAKDLMAFINFDSIKINAKGEVLGVEAEVARLKTEKPYLFANGAEAGQKKKAGMDGAGGGGNETFNMNSAIRRAAGRL